MWQKTVAAAPLTTHDEEVFESLKSTVAEDRWRECEEMARKCAQSESAVKGATLARLYADRELRGIQGESAEVFVSLLREYIFEQAPNLPDAVCICGAQSLSFWLENDTCKLSDACADDMLVAPSDFVVFSQARPKSGPEVPELQVVFVEGATHQLCFVPRARSDEPCRVIVEPGTFLYCNANRLAMTSFQVRVLRPNPATKVPPLQDFQRLAPSAITALRRFYIEVGQRDHNSYQHNMGILDRAFWEAHGRESDAQKRIQMVRSVVQMLKSDVGLYKYFHALCMNNAILNEWGWAWSYFGRFVNAPATGEEEQRDKDQMQTQLVEVLSRGPAPDVPPFVLQRDGFAPETIEQWRKG